MKGDQEIDGSRLRYFPQNVLKEEYRRRPLPALQCEILLIKAEDEERNEALGLDLESEEEWAPGMIRLDEVVMAHWTMCDDEECVRVLLRDDVALVRMSWEEFWQIYADYAAS